MKVALHSDATNPTRVIRAGDRLTLALTVASVSHGRDGTDAAITTLGGTWDGRRVVVTVVGVGDVEVER